jgi:uncharacterized protein YecT (DUF1311 family)
MHRIATALGLLLLMSAPVVAQKEFEPTAAERKTIDDCIDKTAGDSELEQMSKCIGLIADPCVDAPGANTFTIVACNMREQTIWDGRLNEWYGQAQSHLKDNAAAAAALKDAQRAWIQFRDARCEMRLLGEALRGRHIRLSGNRKLHANRNRTARTRDALHLRRSRSLENL